METRVLSSYAGLIYLLILALFGTSTASNQFLGQISPGFKGSQMNWVDKNGRFLLSNNSEFSFGFFTTQKVTSFLLVVLHIGSSKVVWTANRGSPVRNSDHFVFEDNGNAYLEMGDGVVWCTDTGGKGVTVMKLQDNGNLVLLGNYSKPLWQSFNYPTDTLLSGQDFLEGMKLVSKPSPKNLSCYLEISSGDLILNAGFPTPQPYWSISKEIRKTINKVSGEVKSASLSSNSWNFYDKNQVLLWQFIFSDNSNPNITWAAVLDSQGSISFYSLQRSTVAEPKVIPQDSCGTPEPCDPYYVCYIDNKCQCPDVLVSQPNCAPGIDSPCKSSNGPLELVDAGDKLDYFALGFVPPSSKSDLTGCKNACLSNCSCRALFFDNTTGQCFLFDQIGSLKQSSQGSTGFVSYIKVPRDGNQGQNSGGKGSSSSQKHFHIIVIISVLTVLVISGILYLVLWCHNKKKNIPEAPHNDSSEEDMFLESICGAPFRFSFKDLQDATGNFSVKLGHGGFGSVYQGVLPDGTQLAVKKLEGIGQGKKEFRAEVSTIGGIHHVHLVRLKGFCAEANHRLLVYEYMANGSLDRWIFQKDGKDDFLDWGTRFNIALSTAKGLAYLHEDCNVKIIHCDIKPENVLLDDNFLAKVSDFGLAKLMTREQSQVFTTLRGTRGYLAPEWITNQAISEKSDVFSFGMVLLEIIGGRKNFDLAETSEKAHFPSYAFKMMEEGRIKEILDLKLKTHEDDERVITAIKVALWCIQDDMYLRPSMSKVVQMLEGLAPVPQPPTSSQIGSRLYSSLFKSMSEDGTSSGPSDYNSDAYLSDVRLSGPR
ncbi:G-type lectin S-receptor-like serine/threonine-protein kinase SD2-5 [Telopea speciosissima]|uniref:G-type lectin S-receptor-like serine/threonine-protein kinase SD2-5 n=1 Tax=Telopea speciosissima TaxID=54955 RepID=UPI001CC63572|nr:G-type lectin S-receptor-like serine/threonine-protein kinase SD2-5 [Telopea speciosissima]